MTILESVLNAVMVGFGSALGSYLANKTLIKNFETKLEEVKRITGKKENLNSGKG